MEHWPIDIFRIKKYGIYLCTCVFMCMYVYVYVCVQAQAHMWCKHTRSHDFCTLTCIFYMDVRRQLVELSFPTSTMWI